MYTTFSNTFDIDGSRDRTVIVNNEAVSFFEQRNYFRDF